MNSSPSNLCKLPYRTLGVAAALLLCSFAAAPFLAGSAQAQGKKVIYYGWGAPSSSYIAEHWREMGRLPFDGVGITIPLAPDKHRAPHETLGWNMLASLKFSREHYAAVVAQLKSARWSKFTDNFLVAMISSGDPEHSFDWFDDKRFESLQLNWELLVRIAQQSGCVGILLDPEQYGNLIFDYRELNRRAAHSFDDYRKKIFERGVALMRGASKTFPGMQILSMGAHTAAWNGVRDSRNLHQARPLAEAEYGLLPAFIDGMLTGSDPAAIVIDGYEVSYGFKDVGQFVQAKNDIRTKAAALSSVPDLYAARLKVGFALWLDFGGAKEWFAEDLQRNYFTPAAFQNALSAALRQSDRYVWIYSQAAKPFQAKDFPPSYIEAIRAAKQSALQ